MKFTAILKSNFIAIIIALGFQSCIDNSKIERYNCKGCNVEFMVGDSLNSLNLIFKEQFDSLIVVTKSFDSFKDSTTQSGESFFKHTISNQKPLDSSIIINNFYKWNLNGSDSSRVVNFMKLYSVEGGLKKPYGSVEIAKESRNFLNRNYGIDVKDGYLVVERNTCLGRIEPIIENLTNKYDFTKNQSDKLKIEQWVYPDSTEKSINKTDFDVAVRSTQMIWNLMSKTGPSDKVKPNMPVTGILNFIQDSGATIQCQGTRDLVFDMVVTMKPESIDKIRKVDLHRFDSWEGIINNTHALLEVYENNKWVLFDPFIRVYFTNNSGQKLSVKEIQEMKLANKLPEVNVMFIETKQPIVPYFDNSKN